MGTNIIGYGQKTLANPSTAVNLQSGQGYTIPSGQYQVIPGSLTFFQWFDPVTSLWRAIGTASQSDSFVISSDGSNYRLFNGTGTVVGAMITASGTGYVNGIYQPAAQLGTAAFPSVTFSSGGGSVLARGIIIVGGAINTAVTITGAGVGYSLPPILVVSNPPAGGVPATMTCTIAAGVINSVTVTNQGAGYLVAPTVTVINSSGDVTGAGAVLMVSPILVGSGTVTAVTVPQNGVGYTSVPTVTFSPASTTAATPVMCFTTTTVTWSTPSNAGNGNFGIIGSSVVAGTPALINPAIQTGLYTPRFGFTAFNTNAAPTTTTIVDGGLHQVVPNAVLVSNSNGTISGAVTTTIAQGGAVDTSYIVQC